MCIVGAQDNKCMSIGLDSNQFCYLMDTEYEKDGSGETNETMLIFKALQGAGILYARNFQ